MLLAGTPSWAGRQPVIIITWLGMVSITGSERAAGYQVPPSRSASRLAISSISPGRQPSTTIPHARFVGVAAWAAPRLLEKARVAPDTPATLRTVRRSVMGVIT